MNDPIKQKIVELVPGDNSPWHMRTDFHYGCGTPDICDCKERREIEEPSFFMRKITLADVLRAIHETMEVRTWTTGTYSVNMFGEFAEGINGINVYWNLTADFDGQTEEVKTFIGSLLGVTE